MTIAAKKVSVKKRETQKRENQANMPKPDKQINIKKDGQPENKIVFDITMLPFFNQ